MEWIFYLGAALAYYLLKAYQQEKDKNVNKPLTPVNKPLKQGQKKPAPKTITATPTKSESQKQQPKTLEDIWKELKEAANREEYGNYEPEKNILDTQLEPEKEILDTQENPWKNIRSIEYDDVPSYESIDKIPAAEGAPSTIQAVPLEAYQEKTVKQKYLVVNGKHLTPQDLFIAQMILERKI